ncbi:MAG: hypothetical protein K9G76_01640 [Bacteroidales bacterium]|nr:hypothetical protein [Bacteroidales bacterium]MCF8403256.1 hypothetical protein [Bacteroidales bacterium]
MEGIDYIIDDSGEKKAIIIALDKFGEYVEDIEDMLVAINRIKEPRISLEEVEEKYSKLKGKNV